MTKPLFRGLFLDFYDGSYGPTLRFETDAIEDLERLKTLFEAMTSQASVEILPSAGAVSEGVKGLTLQNRSAGFWMQVTGDAVEGYSFTWAEDADGWLDAAGLIDGMLESVAPGHQYLTPEHPVLVVVAFQESSDASR